MTKSETSSNSPQSEAKEVDDTTQNSDDKKEEFINTEQDTVESIQIENNHTTNEAQFNSFHGEHKYHPHHYNLYLTPITEEIDHDRTIVGLKEQNNKLTEQLRFLNSKLTEILSKQQKKITQKQPLEQNSKDASILQKELDNSYKKVEYLKKQNKFLQQKIEKLSPQMLYSLENQLKEKDQQIQKQQDEIKMFDNFKRMQMKNNDIESKQTDFQLKVDEQEKQIQNLNQEIKKLKYTIDNSSKQTIKKQEYQVDLEQKYRELCDYIGISSNFKANFKEELSKLQVIKKSDNLTVVKQLQPFTDMTNQINNSEKQHQIQDQNNQKCLSKVQENQIKELTNQLKLKDKEMAELKSQIQEFKNIQRTPESLRIKHHKTNKSQIIKSTGVSPLRNGSKVMSVQEKKLEQIGSILEKNKSVPKRQKENEDLNIQCHLNPLKDISQKVKKEIIGKQNGCSKTISDRIVLKETLHTKIVKAIVWTNKRTINGMQFFYKLNNSDSIIEGQKIVIDKHNEYVQVICDFTYKPQDYLKYIECATTSQGFIDKVKFTTAKGQILEAGAQSTQGRQIQKYNIDECEYPVCAFGGLITFVGEKGQEVGGILSYMGFEVMIDQGITKKIHSKYVPQGYSTFFYDKDVQNQQNNRIRELHHEFFDSNNNSQ